MRILHIGKFSLIKLDFSFFVVANTQGILIHIHRATEIPLDASHFELVMPDRPEYRLTFQYREFARITGEDGFTRESH